MPSKLIVSILSLILMTPLFAAEPATPVAKPNKFGADVFERPRLSAESQLGYGLFETTAGVLFLANKHRPPVLPTTVKIELSLNPSEPDAFFKQLTQETANARIELAKVGRRYQTAAERDVLLQRAAAYDAAAKSTTPTSAQARQFELDSASIRRSIVTADELNQLRTNAEAQITKAQTAMIEYAEKNGPTFEKLKGELGGLAERKIINAEGDIAKMIGEATKRPSLAMRGVRWVGRLGGATLLVDAGGRAYVWYGLEKDPSFSPVGTYLLHQVKDISLTNLFSAVEKERDAAYAWKTEKTEEDYFSRVKAK